MVLFLSPRLTMGFIYNKVQLHFNRITSINMLTAEANNSLISRTIKYVSLKLQHEPSGHDWHHVDRVWRTAKFLQSKEGGDLLVIELAALLHNLREHNAPLYMEEKSLLALHGMMDILQIEEPLKSQVLEIIEESKFKADETHKSKSIEGKILQDANWLDSLGAIGVARAFASGGHMGRSIYDPDVPVREKMDKQTYQKEKKSGTSLNYLYEKSLRVVDYLNTEAAKKVAISRAAFIKTYIDQFKKEWNGEDLFIM